MRKTFGIVLAVLAMAVPASAQAICWGCIPGDMLEDIYYVVRGDNVGLVTAGNLRMVRDLTGQLPRSLSGDLVMNGGYYGISTPRSFHPMLDQNRRPLSGRQRIERGAGIVAMADGARRIINNPRGAAGWIEAAVGAVLVNDSRYRGEPKKNQRDGGVIVTPPSQGQQDGVPVGVGTRPNRQEPVSSPPSTVGEWRVTNQTSKRAELWDGDQFIDQFEPWESKPVSAPVNGFKAVLLIPNRSGGLNKEAAQIRSSDNFNGWDIIAPAVQ